MFGTVLRGGRVGLREAPARVRVGLCAAHLALITALSLVPAWLFPPSLAEIPGVDKWAHAAMYGLLGALLRWAHGGGGAAARHGLPLAAAAYGLLMECLQLQLGGGTRMFSWGDAAANWIGAVAGGHAAGRGMGEAARTARTKD